MILSPKVGQPMIYWPHQTDNRCLRDATPYHAIVSEVHADGTVNLSVLERLGCWLPKGPVKVHQPADAAEPHLEYCEFEVKSEAENPPAKKKA